MTDGTRSFVDESKGKCLQPSHKLPFLSQPTTTTTRISLYKSRLCIKTALKRGFHVQVSRTKAPEGKMGGDLNTKVAFEAPELVQARLVHCARCAPSARERVFSGIEEMPPGKDGVSPNSRTSTPAGRLSGTTGGAPRADIGLWRTATIGTTRRSSLPVRQFGGGALARCYPSKRTGRSISL